MNKQPFKGMQTTLTDQTSFYIPKTVEVNSSNSNINVRASCKSLRLESNIQA